MALSTLGGVGGCEYRSRWHWNTLLRRSHGSDQTSSEAHYRYLAPRIYSCSFDIFPKKSNSASSPISWYSQSKSISIPLSRPDREKIAISRSDCGSIYGKYWFPSAFIAVATRRSKAWLRIEFYSFMRVDQGRANLTLMQLFDALFSALLMHFNYTSFSLPLSWYFPFVQLYSYAQRDNYVFDSFPVILKCLLSIDSSAEIIDEVMRGLIQKLGSKAEKSDTLLNIFEILLKSNPRAAFVVDSQGRLLLHYASKYLKNVTCATDVIKALLLVHKDAASIVDNDECYAITTAGAICCIWFQSLQYCRVIYFNLPSFLCIWSISLILTLFPMMTDSSIFNCGHSQASLWGVPRFN